MFLKTSQRRLHPYQTRMHLHLHCCHKTFSFSRWGGLFSWEVTFEFLKSSLQDSHEWWLVFWKNSRPTHLRRRPQPRGQFEYGMKHGIDRLDQFVSILVLVEEKVRASTWIFRRRKYMVVNCRMGSSMEVYFIKDYFDQISQEAQVMAGV